MTKSTILAYTQGAVTGAIWSFSVVYLVNNTVSPYVFVPALVASGAGYFASSAYADDEYYNSMSKSYYHVTGSFFLGRILKTYLSPSIWNVEIIDGTNEFIKSDASIFMNGVLYNFLDHTLSSSLYFGGNALHNYMHPELNIYEDNIIDLAGVNAEELA